MQFNADFITKVSQKLKAAPPNFVAGYTIDVEMKTPPVRIVVGAMDEAEREAGNVSTETKDIILRHSIMGKPVSVLYKGKSMGSFVLNDLAAAWDGFPVVVEHPHALRLMYSIAMYRMMEKWLPPQVDAQPAAANVTPGSTK